jgi:hypothetical protein
MLQLSVRTLLVLAIINSSLGAANLDSYQVVWSVQAKVCASHRYKCSTNGVPAYGVVEPGELVVRVLELLSGTPSHNQGCVRLSNRGRPKSSGTIIAV